MRSALLVALLVLAVTSAPADELRAPPFELPTTDAIRDWVVAHKGFGTPGWKEVAADSRRLFVIWNLPTSGLDINHVYTYRERDGRWMLLDRVYVHGPPALSVEYEESSAEIIYRRGGETFRRLRLQALGP